MKAFCVESLLIACCAVAVGQRVGRLVCIELGAQCCHQQGDPTRQRPLFLLEGRQTCNADTLRPLRGGQCRSMATDGEKLRMAVTWQSSRHSTYTASFILVRRKRSRCAASA